MSREAGCWVPGWPGLVTNVVTIEQKEGSQALGQLTKLRNSAHPDPGGLKGACMLEGSQVSASCLLASALAPFSLNPADPVSQG